MNKDENSIREKHKSYLKESKEHGFEEYTENVVKEKVIVSFGNGYGCGGNCSCKNKKRR